MYKTSVILRVRGTPRSPTRQIPASTGEHPGELLVVRLQQRAPTTSRYTHRARTSAGGNAKNPTHREDRQQRPTHRNRDNRETDSRENTAADDSVDRGSTKTTIRIVSTAVDKCRQRLNKNTVVSTECRQLSTWFDRTVEQTESE